MTHSDIHDEELDAADGGIIPLVLAAVGVVANAEADSWRNAKQTEESLSGIDKLNAMKKNTQILKDIHETNMELRNPQSNS